MAPSGGEGAREQVVLSLSGANAEKLATRAAAYGEDAQEWLEAAVMQYLDGRPALLGEPPMRDGPFFAYGMLKSTELAHSQIRPYVDHRVPAVVSDYHLRTRDGLPLLIEGGGEVQGELLRFSDPDEAYGVIRRYEAAAHYRWVPVVAREDGRQVHANALLARSPTRGSDSETLSNWTASADPVLVDGLRVAQTLAGDVSTEVDAAPFEGEVVVEFFRLAAAYLLLMTVAERLSTLLFGASVSPTQRIRQLETLDGFSDWWVEVGGRSGDRVIDSRDPQNSVTIGTDGKRAWTYWYAVRSNLAHRGKGAWRDVNLLRKAFHECSFVLERSVNLAMPRDHDGP